MSTSSVKKIDAAQAFLQAVRDSLSYLCKIAPSEAERLELVEILRKIRLVAGAGIPGALAFADQAGPWVVKYSEKITSRDEAFLSSVRLSEECAASGVSLAAEDGPVVRLFESFQGFYRNADQQIRDNLYKHILEIHNSALAHACSEWF